MAERTAAPAARRAERSAAFPGARTVFRVGGVPVRLDLSWLLIAGLVLWVFVSRFTDLLGHLGWGPLLAAGAAAALAFFASILAHELGHALASVERDVPVTGITLFLLGGVTESTREPRRARDEFVIVGIGPFVSLVLAAAFGLAHTAFADVAPVAVVTGYLAWTNLLLAIFNVLPGYPLDGGRLLRSVLWGATGDAHRATRWAARVGQAFALALVGLGGWVLLGSARTGLGGIWEILIGLFLLRGATDAYRQARERERLTGHRVGELMGSVSETLPAHASLADVVERLEQRPSVPWPVGAPVQGVLRHADLDRVPAERWSAVRVADLAAPTDETTVRADAPLEHALALLAAAPGQVLVVLDDEGRAVGVLTPSLLGGLQG